MCSQQTSAKADVTSQLAWFLRKSAIGVTAFLVLAAVAAGCVIIPTAPTPEQARFEAEIRRLEPGKTTRDQVQERLGLAAARLGLLLDEYDDGRFWVYMWLKKTGELLVQGSGGGPMMRYYAVAIEFGADGRVLQVQQFAPWISYGSPAAELRTQVEDWIETQRGKTKCSPIAWKHVAPALLDHAAYATGLNATVSVYILLI